MRAVPGYNRWGRRSALGAAAGAAACVVVCAVACALVIGAAFAAWPAAAQGGGQTTYTVQPGDTLGAIAQRYGVTVNALLRENGLPDANTVWSGQLLTIPGAATAKTSTPTRGAGAGATYTVLPGDTLASIADSLAVSVADLMAANHITDPDLLASGQRLIVPTPTGAPTPTPAPTPAGAPAPTAAAASGPTMRPGETLYTVASGDTLAKIAARYRSSAALLARLNHLDSMDRIIPGMKLIVPMHAQEPKNWPGAATRVVVSISQQRCWVYQANAVIGDWPCSTGRKGFDTRPGVYKIKTKMDRAWGSAWSFWMPYWLGIYDAGGTEDGFHGLPYGPDNKGHLWSGFVGTPITFGCILLDDKHARALYDLAYIGLPVVVQR